jgi:hypothetical protein
MPDNDAVVEVYVGTVWQAGQVQGLLESAGIACFMRDEMMGSNYAPVLSAGGVAAVTILVGSDDADRAAEVVRDFGAGSGLHEPQLPPVVEATGSPWPCPRCFEQVEGQFDVCWKCGALRPPDA